MVVGKGVCDSPTRSEKRRAARFSVTTTIATGLRRPLALEAHIYSISMNRSGFSVRQGFVFVNLNLCTEFCVSASISDPSTTLTTSTRI